MVWFNPLPTPIQQSPAPPRPDDRVMPVAHVKDQPSKRSSQEKNRRRRQLFDILMQEVEAIPELEAPAKARLRDNLRELARYTDQPIPPRQATPQAPNPAADPHRHAGGQPDGHAGGQAGGHADGHAGGDDHHAEHVVAVLARPPLAAGPEPLPPEAAEESLRLAEQLRRCLSVHTDRARKISSYIQALLALTEDVHTLELEA